MHVDTLLLSVVNVGLEQQGVPSSDPDSIRLFAALRVLRQTQGNGFRKLKLNLCTHSCKNFKYVVGITIIENRVQLLEAIAVNQEQVEHIVEIKAAGTCTNALMSCRV